MVEQLTAEEVGRRIEQAESFKDPAEEIESLETLLDLVSRDRCPIEWARAQHNLARAYLQTPCGDGAENIERAIAHCEAALAIRTREAFPEDWARTQNCLALGYKDRIRGVRTHNLEMAIAHFEAALTVRTREAFPEDWAGTQSNLANAYIHRTRGEWADNLETAIAHFEAALTVCTREAFPKTWALIVSNLASAYRQRIRGERADNLETAIAHCEAALTFYTREGFPKDWARTQVNLASAYRQRVRGERADNVEMGIAHHKAALTVYTREGFPEDWARTQENLAIAFDDRIHGTRADNLEMGIAHHDAALTVYSREAFPSEHLWTSQNLGVTLLKARDWKGASIALADARETFLLQFGQGLEETEARYLIEAAAPLHSSAAFAATELGCPEKALSLLSQGRARLIASALKLQTLNLPSDQRSRLETLRASIRQQSRILEHAIALVRTEVLDRLAKLHGELSTLIAATCQPAATDAMACARSLLVEGGAIVAPIVTVAGGKLLVLTSTEDGPALTVIDQPELTNERLELVMRGASPNGKPDPASWLGTFGAIHASRTLRRARIEAIGHELWRLFAGALDTVLRQCGVKSGSRLIWLPSGALGLLPIGLAQDAATGRRFIDDYEIVFAPCLEALATGQNQLERAAAPSLLAVVNPTHELVFSSIEGALVAGHFPEPTRMLLDESTGTAEAVLAALKDRSYWHFSTHGQFVWDDARASSLLMKDNTRLTVDALLEARGLGQPRLVVLSACETGLYDVERTPDEFIGLPAAFISLGAAGVLATIWRVDDRATALLIGRFYDLHLSEGLAPPAALREAQQWLRRATRDDLVAYARAAAGQGRLDGEKLGRLERSLGHASEEIARFAWSNGSEEPAREQVDGAMVDADETPFEHPIYWGGFIYTGV